MSWHNRTALMSPAEERAFWLEVVTKYTPTGGIAVNCRHMPTLSRTPQLQALIDQGLVVRIRENRQWGVPSRKSRSRRTLLILKQEKSNESTSTD